MRIRDLIWPRNGFIRAWKYLAIRLSRIAASPHGIAAGFAAGVAISFTPLLGLHIALGCALAFVTRGSILAALLGTLAGNPITFPLFFSATYWVGARIKEFAAAGPYQAVKENEEELAEADAAADSVLDAAEGIIEGSWSFAALDVLWPVISTMLIGAMLLVPIVYAACYLATRVALRSFERRKRGESGCQHTIRRQ